MCVDKGGEGLKNQHFVDIMNGCPPYEGSPTTLEPHFLLGFAAVVTAFPGPNPE